MFRFNGRLYRIQEVSFIVLAPPVHPGALENCRKVTDAIPCVFADREEPGLVLQETENLYGRKEILLLNALRCESLDFEDIQII